MGQKLFILTTAFIICADLSAKAQEAGGADERIAVIGDMNAESLGKSLAKIAEREKIDLFQAVQRGSSVLDWNKHDEWLAWMGASFNPTLVIIVLGTCEAESARGAEELAPDFTTLYESMVGDGRRIVWAKPLLTAKRKNADAVNAAIEGSGAIWIDSNETIKVAGNALKKADYGRWAADIAKAIGL